MSKPVHELCKSKLLACLADLITASTPHTKIKESEVQQEKRYISGGSHWVTKVLEYIAELEEDKKHVTYCQEPDTEYTSLVQDARKVVKELNVGDKSVCPKLRC